MARLGAAPEGVYSDDGSTLLGLMGPNGVQYPFVTQYLNFLALSVAAAAGALQVGAYVVAGSFYFWDGSNLRSTDGGKTIRLVSGSVSLPNANYTGATDCIGYTTHTAFGTITNLGIAVVSWYNNEVTYGGTSGSLTVSAAIEYPIGGTRQRITFSGGNNGTCPAGGNLSSDLITLTTPIPNGAKYRIWQEHVNPVDYVYVDQNCYPDDNGDLMVYNNSGFGSYSVTNGTWAQISALKSGNTPYGYAMRPAVIFGVTTSPQPAIAAIGDSRTVGKGDYADYSRLLGSSERGYGALVAVARYGLNGETGTYFAASAPKRQALINQYFTHVACDYGINDIEIGGLTTVAQFQTMLSAIAATLPGLPFYPCTIRPHTIDTTTGYTNITGQTIANTTLNGYRVVFNNMLRTYGDQLSGAIPGMADFFELANDVEVNASNVLTQDGGYWMTNPTMVLGYVSGLTLYVSQVISGQVQLGSYIGLVNGNTVFSASPIYKALGSNQYAINPNANNFATTSGSGSLAFTAGFAAGAYNGTLNANWSGTTGFYAITFSDGEVRTSYLTNNSANANWGVALTGTPTASATYAGINCGSSGSPVVIVLSNTTADGLHEAAPMNRMHSGLTCPEFPVTGQYRLNQANTASNGTNNNNTNNQQILAANLTASSGTTAYQFGYLPPNAVIESITINNTTANAVTGGINIGTSSGGAQILSAQAVGANGFVRVNGGSLVAQAFKSGANLFVNAVTSWNAASLNITVNFTITA